MNFATDVVNAREVDAGPFWRRRQLFVTPVAGQGVPHVAILEPLEGLGGIIVPPEVRAFDIAPEGREFIIGAVSSQGDCCS